MAAGTEIAMLIALALAAATPAAAPTLLDQIKAHRLEITPDRGGGYAGAGWDRLIEEGRRSQFFMAGEQHGTADIAALEVALQRRLIDDGYTHLALEVGPVTARFVERLGRSEPDALAAWLRQPGHGFTVPFLFFADELPMVTDRLARSPGRTDVVWGVDQEFVGAMPILLDRLRPLATTPAQKAAVDALAARSQADPLLVARLTPADVDALDRAFASAGAAAREVVDALHVTVDIYGPFTRRTGPTHPANLARETYMKRNFLAAFTRGEEAGAAPRVFLKFGANHAMRGMSGTDVPGFANFLAEWGLSRGYATTNIFVGCQGGEALNPQTNRPMPCESYFAGGDPFLPALGPGKITMFDLKAVRPALEGRRGDDPRLRELILAFDYYLVVRDVAPSTPVSAEFGPNNRR